MADVEQKVLTTPTFINGSLQPAGTLVAVDPEQFVDEDGKPIPIDDKKQFPNLGNVGEAAVLVATPVAAIAPTGPNPTMPQQVPPGVMQTLAGYASGGALLVAEGSEAAATAARGEGEAALNEGVEEEAVQRLNDTAQGAGTAGSGTDMGANGTNGTETGALDEGKPVTGDNQPVGDTTRPGLSGMNKAELLAQAKAENVADVTEDNNMAEIKAKIEAARSAS